MFLSFHSYLYSPLQGSILAWFRLLCPLDDTASHSKHFEIKSLRTCAAPFWWTPISLTRVHIYSGQLYTMFVIGTSFPPVCWYGHSHILLSPKAHFWPKVCNKLFLSNPGCLCFFLWFLSSFSLYTSFQHNDFSQSSSTVICLGQLQVLRLLGPSAPLCVALAPLCPSLILGAWTFPFSFKLSLCCGNQCVCLLCPTMHCSHSNSKPMKSTRVPVSAWATKREREIHIWMLL